MQWLLNGTAIAGATGQSYTPVAADVGKQLSCTVTATYPLLHVTVSATSAAVEVLAAGGGGGGTTTPHATALSVSPRSFTLTGRLVKGRCVATSRANRTHGHCTRSIVLRISFKLDIPSRVTFTIKRARSGRLVKGQCIASTRANRHNRSCARLIAVGGSFTQPGNAGSNSFTFNEPIGGQSLTPGSYRLTATPTSNGGTGNTQTSSFQILP